MERCSYWLCDAKNKHNSLWSDQKKQTYKKTPWANIQADTDAGQLGWAPEVAET